LGVRIPLGAFDLPPHHERTTIVRSTAKPKAGVRMFIYILAACFFVGFLYYRRKYKLLLCRHRDSAVRWRELVMTNINGHLENYFKDSEVTNHIIRINDEQNMEISIGNDEVQVPVDMAVAQNELGTAFDDAYTKFLGQI
jgi:hypothetical protein